MSLALIYWLTMFLWMIFSAWSNWPATGGNFRPFGGNLLLFIVLILLGWKVFGAPVHA